LICPTTLPLSQTAENSD